MKRVAVYCRVSTDHEDQKNSIENQKLYFEEYVSQHKGWKLVEIYADEGITGTSLRKRKHFNRMYRDSLKGKYDIILTKEVCRFARNTVDTLEKTRELKRLNVEVRFIIDNISTFDTDGELRLTIMAGLAQDESRRISERVQFGVIQSMKKGVAFGNIIYGYDFVRDEITGKKTKLVINEEEAKVVRYIFHAYLHEGKGAYTIANELKKRGVLVKRPRNKKVSTDWRTGTILDILRNEKYVGDLKQRKTYTVDYLEHIKKQNKGEVEYIYIKDHHPAIIDRETFEETQRELKRRSELYKHEESKYSNKHTFSGKLTCNCCGGSYVAGVQRKRKDGTIRRSWRCATAVNYGKKHIVESGEEVGCDNERVNDELLKQSFAKAMTSIVDNKKQITKDIEVILKDVLEHSRDNIQEGENLINEREKLNREKNKLLDLCIKEIITEDTFKTKNEEIEQKLARLDEEIKEQENRQMLRENIEDILNEARKIINNILTIKEFSKNVCRELVKNVVIYNATKFDFYLKGYKDPFMVDCKGNILYSQHL